MLDSRYQQSFAHAGQIHARQDPFGPSRPGRTDCPSESVSIDSWPKKSAAVDSIHL